MGQRIPGCPVDPPRRTWGPPGGEEGDSQGGSSVHNGRTSPRHRPGSRRGNRRRRDRVGLPGGQIPAPMRIRGVSAPRGAQEAAPPAWCPGCPRRPPPAAPPARGGGKRGQSDRQTDREAGTERGTPTLTVGGTRGCAPRSMTMRLKSLAEVPGKTRKTGGCATPDRSRSSRSRLTRGTLRRRALTGAAGGQLLGRGATGRSGFWGTPPPQPCWVDFLGVWGAGRP